jgi:hypothetical protein
LGLVSTQADLLTIEDVQAKLTLLAAGSLQKATTFGPYRSANSRRAGIQSSGGHL